MPWKEMSEVPENLKSLDGAPLTLEQANTIAAWADAMEKEGAASEPWARVIARFKEEYEIADGRWRQKQDGAVGLSSNGNNEAPVNIRVSCGPDAPMRRAAVRFEKKYFRRQEEAGHWLEKYTHHRAGAARAIEERGDAFVYTIHDIPEGTPVREKPGHFPGVTFVYAPAAARKSNFENNANREAEEMKTDDVSKNNVEPVTFDIPDVEIFRAGVWTDSAGRTVTYTAEDIERMAAAHCELGGNFEAPVKLGHDPEQPLLRTDGLPAAGWLRNFRTAGGRLIADLTGVPKKVYDLIRAGAYKKRSLEVLHNFRDEATGRIYPHVAAGLALLGARLPAIGSLSDIRALYETNGGAAAYLYEAGPAGITVIVEQQAITEKAEKADITDETAGDETENEYLMEIIRALEARIAELEAAVADGSEAETAEIADETPDAAAGEEIEEPATQDDAVTETPYPEGEAVEAVEAIEETEDAGQDEEPLEGTPIEPVEESIPDETVAEEPIEEPVAEETAIEEKEAELSEISERETAIEAIEEKLRAALRELEDYRRLADEARAAARGEFISRHARKVPPAFRAVVHDVLALLDGDLPPVSEYGIAGCGCDGMAFRRFVASIPDHPAMSEYGREDGGNSVQAASATESELDTRIRSYCAERGLDHDSASDYAAAAIAVLEYERPPSPDEKASITNQGFEKLCYRNFPSGMSPCFSGPGVNNNSEDSSTGDMTYEYSVLSKAWDFLKEKLGEGIRTSEELVKAGAKKGAEIYDEARNVYAAADFIRTLNGIQERYEKCMKGGGKNCDEQATREARDAAREYYNRMHDEMDLGHRMAFMMIFGMTFEQIKAWIKGYVKDNYPQYRWMIRF